MSFEQSFPIRIFVRAGFEYFTATLSRKALP